MLTTFIQILLVIVVAFGFWKITAAYKDWAAYLEEDETDYRDKYVD